MRRVVTFFIIIVVPVLSAFAELPVTWTMTGQTPANVASSPQYTFYNGNLNPGGYFITDKGTVISSYESGTVYYATIQWTTAGTTTLYFKSAGGTTLGSKAITVSDIPHPAQPNTTLVITGCATSLITRQSNPPSGITWYWQNSSSGTSLSLGSGPSFNVTTSGTYYLRAKMNDLPYYWSNTSFAAPSIIVGLKPTGTVSGGGTACSNTTANAVTFTFTGNAPFTFTYTNGQSPTTVTNFSQTVYTLAHPESGDFLLTSLQHANGCTADNLSTTPVHVVTNYTPATPFLADDQFDGMDVHGTGQFPLQTVVPDNAEARWYTSSDLTTPFFAGSASTTPVTINGTTTFFVSLKDLTSQCESGKWPFLVDVIPFQSPSNATLEVIRVPGKLTDWDAKYASAIEKNTTISFKDGLSRLHQVISLHTTPTGKDIVQALEYDPNGRQSKTYLPYTATSNGSYQATYGGDQVTFYHNGADKISDEVAGESVPNAVLRNSYEGSPLGRIVEQGTAGTAWQPGGHTVRTAYSYNVANEVRRFNPDGTSTSFWAENTLNRVETTNGNGYKTISYLNGDQVLLRKQQIDKSIDGVTVDYLETYYIYSDLGKLNFIVQPKGVAALKLSAWSLTQTIKDQYVFEFVYDVRGRLTQKKVPGSGWSYLVYDQLNRVVLTQDNNIRGANQWFFVKYDIQNRPVMSGLYTDATNTTLASVQALLDSKNYESTDSYFETRQAATTHGYSNVTFPVTGIDILAVNYYDDYDFNFDATQDYGYTTTGIAGENLPGRSFGLPTGNKKVVVGGATWITSYFFYDEYGRIIQTRSNNHLNPSVISNLATVSYDFEGKVIASKTQHDAGGANQTIVSTRPVYDTYTGLAKQIFHKVNSNPEVLAVQLEYNELRQVVDKKLHSTNGGSSFLQSVDYRYNLRGQLTSINNASLTSDGLNDDTNDLFGMELLYASTETGLNDQSTDIVNFDGNVSAIKWKGAGDGSGLTGRRSYKFNYDKAGKMEAATFQAYGTSWNAEANTLSENISYDHNGNIYSINRNKNLAGFSGTSPTSSAQAIDNLSYTYTGNQVTKVEDATADVAGFSNGASITTEYAYDASGNVTMDKNKGIESVQYNCLGKVSRIQFTDNRVIAYTYDAAGTKLTVKAFAANGTLQSTTDYANSFIYENGALREFSSPEGRVLNNGGTIEYQYAIADHQGNTRAIFTSAAPTPTTITATFEGDSGDASSVFGNVSTTTFVAANKTVGGSKVIQLNQNNKVKATKSLKVYPGDKVDLSAWSYYENGSGFGSSNFTAATMITAIAGAFGGVSGGAGESGSIFGGINSAIGGFGLGSNPGDGAPAAFLNYILFDRNYAVVDMGWAAVPSGAFMSKQPISIPTVNVTKAGFIFVYLSYEDQSNNSVEFDDLAITVTPSNLVQYNEYYPFGLQTQQSWTRENMKNNFLYNGGSELNASSGWYDLPFRNYDAALGRFFQVDALSVAEHTLSPYQYAGNNPIVFNDPTGLLKATAAEFAAFVKSALAGNGGTWSDDSGPVLFNNEAEAEAFVLMNPEMFPGALGTYQSSGYTLTRISETTNNFYYNITWRKDMTYEFVPNAIFEGPGEDFLTGLDEKNASQGDPKDGWWNHFVKWLTDPVLESTRGNTERMQADRRANPGKWKTFDNIGMASSLFLPGGGVINIFKGKAALQATEYTLTQTVANGLVTRPFLNSPLLVQEIMSTGAGVADASFPGGMNWVVQGTFNGSKGVYELGVNPETNVIYHFLFKSIP